MADVLITEFTDPGCPWAYSAEPFRQRLSWLYGDCLDWEVRVVGLAESPADYEERGFGPKQRSAASKKISSEHGMPIDTEERSRMAATLPGSHAIVAARSSPRAGTLPAEDLGRVADEDHVGFDGFWSLNGHPGGAARST